jgi:nickel superoxide dismutase
MRIDMIHENIITIEKSMNMINELATGDKMNYNQMVRWVNNKEEHK